MKLRPGMTATVSIVVGEAQNALRVLNSALRFQPSPEVLQALFEEMRREREAAGGSSSPTDGQAESKKPSQTAQSNRPSNFQMGSGALRERVKDRARVWIEDENGKLRMVLIRTGVTDNIYTEITEGDIKEGQAVIIGENGGGESSDRRSSNLRRGMMFMR
jgi:HlyD family secretion protein